MFAKAALLLATWLAGVDSLALRTLFPSAGELVPKFAPTFFTYSLTTSEPSISLTTVADGPAIVTVNGVTVPDGRSSPAFPLFSLKAGQNKTIAIAVMDLSGNVAANYTVVLIRSEPEKKELLGYIACLIAVLFFGSNFVPIKKFATGDPIYFQWILCVAIWHVGLVVNLVQGQPEFQPLAMLGGAVWCTGNLFTVPIVNRIGLGLGLLVWGGVGMVMGWASGYFGFLDTNSQADDINNKTLNFIGVGCAVLSMLVSTFVKTTQQPKDDGFDEFSDVADSRTLNDGTTQPKRRISDRRAFQPSNSAESYMALDPERAEPAQPSSSLRMKIEGYLMAVLAGCCYGINFTPPQHVKDRVDGASQNNMDYVFSHFSGILIASTCYFIIFCIYRTWIKGGSVDMQQKVVVPAFISGLMWAIAQTAWFFANSQLPYVVTFPITSTGPGFIGALWGLLVFREIRGASNYIALGGVFLCLVACVLLITQSH